MKKILVTGAQGYIGTRLIQLLHKKYNIVATDSGFFKTALLKNIRSIKVIKMDLRKFNYKILKNVDTIIHLGALSNDPSVKLIIRLLKT